VIWFHNQIVDLSSKTGVFFAALAFKSWPLIVLDVIIVATLIYWGYLFLRQTRAIRILYGLLILIILMLLAKLLDLVLLNWILQYMMAMLIVAIPIVFQPELRNALETLGRSSLIGDFSKHPADNDIFDRILSAVKTLSSLKTGALIVLQRKTGLREYIERGVKINADISAELIISIFLSKSPLHDGAVIIVGSRLVSASAMLPVTDMELSAKFGSRHRAAIGITENSDAISVVVSEETGAVSLAVAGEIERRISEERLKNRLISLMRNK